VRRCHARPDLTEEENTMPDGPDLVIEYSIDGGVTWHHGKTVPGRVRHDKHALLAQRAAVRELAHAGHGDEVIITRVLSEGDPRAVLNRPSRGGSAGGTITVTRHQLLTALYTAGLATPGADAGVWDRLAAASPPGPPAAPTPADDGLARQQAAEALREWHAAMSPPGPPAPADDGLARQQAAEALAERQAAMTDEGSLGDMLSAGEQMAEFIAGWLDAGGAVVGTLARRVRGRWPACADEPGQDEQETGTMAQIEMSGTPEIRVSRAEDGEIILVIRADGGSVQIRAGRTGEDAGLLFRSLKDAGHAAFMIEEDWPAEQDAAAHDDQAAEATAWSAYKRYRARLAAAMESIEKRDRRRAAVSRRTDPDDED
jgi:hypothetical protein